MRLVPLLLPLLIFAAPASAREAAPAAHCLDARRVVEVVQADAATLGMRLDDESRFRVDLAAACPGIAADDGVQLLSRAGWVCGREGDALRSSARQCPVARVAAVDARTFAALALRERRDGGPVLASVSVKGKRGRGFDGSPAFCLDAAQMRGWHEDRDGIVVEVGRRNSGGNRLYRLELGGGCQSLASTTQLLVSSRFGKSVVCGYPGDIVRFSSEATAAGVFERPVSERSMVSSNGCPITAVYPIERRRGG
jgi:hypothetical protein